MTKLTELDGVLKNQDDTSDDASDYFEEPSKLKKRKDGKIYDQYMSFGSLSLATDHFKKIYCKQPCRYECLFCSNSWHLNRTNPAKMGTNIVINALQKDAKNL